MFISKWDNFDNLFFESGAKIISKRGSYFKVGNKIVQSGANGAAISKWGNYLSQAKQNDP